YAAADDGGYRLAHPWNFDQVGSGGVYSSVEDLARWDRNFYTEEVGGPGFTERLLDRGVLADGDTISYAFGLSHGEYRGLATVAHGGSLAGFRSHLLRFPDERTTVLVLCSFPASDPTDRARQVADIVLADRLAPLAAADDEDATEPAEDRATTVELNPDELDAFVGHWRASIGPVAEIVRDGERLFFIQDDQRAPLAVLAEDRLRLDAADLEFTFSRRIEGAYRFADVVQRDQEFTAERFDPDAAERDQSWLVGEYHSEELDATYRIFEGEAGLMMEIPPARTARVYVVEDGDRVRHPAMTLELERREGRVVGFTIDAGRVRGVYFQRRGESAAAAS
ncbi:MAG: serine hydrolase, partial [Gemmatimonadota bacterium]